MALLTPEESQEGHRRRSGSKDASVRHRGRISGTSSRSSHQNHDSKDSKTHSDPTSTNDPIPKHSSSSSSSRRNRHGKTPKTDCVSSDDEPIPKHSSSSRQSRNASSSKHRNQMMTRTRRSCDVVELPSTENRCLEEVGRKKSDGALHVVRHNSKNYKCLLPRTTDKADIGLTRTQSFHREVSRISLKDQGKTSSFRLTRERSGLEAPSILFPSAKGVEASKCDRPNQEAEANASRSKTSNPAAPVNPRHHDRKTPTKASGRKVVSRDARTHGHRRERSKTRLHNKVASETKEAAMTDSPQSQNDARSPRERRHRSSDSPTQENSHPRRERQRSLKPRHSDQGSERPHCAQRTLGAHLDIDGRSRLNTRASRSSSGSHADRSIRKVRASSRSSSSCARRTRRAVATDETNSDCSGVDKQEINTYRPQELNELPPNQLSLAEFIDTEHSSTIQLANKAWRMIREIAHYDQVLGGLLFTHLFENSPLSKTLFGFERDIDPRCSQVRASQTFIYHAKAVVSMIEKTMELLADLGPQSAKLPDLLHDIGRKHSLMVGMEESMLFAMETAIIESISDMLGPRRFTPLIQQAFRTVYHMLALEILHGMRSHKIVSSSWAKLKLVDDYKSQVALLVFQHLFKSCPEAKEMFGFVSDDKIDGEALEQSDRCRSHSAHLIMMLERAVKTSDAGHLQAYLEDIGKKHLGIRLTKEHLVHMGNALVHALNVLLKDDFDKNTKAAWRETYERMSSHMVSTMTNIPSEGIIRAVVLGGHLAFDSNNSSAVDTKVQKGIVLKKTARIATKKAGKMLRAFTYLTKNAEETSAVSMKQSVQKGRDKLRGTETHAYMVNRDHNMANFVDELHKDALRDVKGCWALVKKIPQYEEKAGLLLFTNLFELCPMAKHVFGFPSDANFEWEELRKNPFFLEHSSSLIKVIEDTMTMMVSATGSKPNNYHQLSLVLRDLGKKHSRMAVDEGLYSVMGKALIETMRSMVGHRKFSAGMEKSWELVYGVLASEMIRGMTSDQIVLSTWTKLKTVDDWQQKAGLLLYQHMFEHCPETKIVFGFPVDLAVDTASLRANPAFRMHSEYFMMMVDKAMSMVESQSFNEHMSALGRKHACLGVAPEHFAYMGQALFFAMETLIKDHFDDKTKQAWLDVYGRMSSQVMAAMELNQ